MGSFWSVIAPSEGSQTTDEDAPLQRVLPTTYFAKLQKRLVRNLSPWDNKVAKLFTDSNDIFLNLLIRVDCWAEGDKTVSFLEALSCLLLALLFPVMRKNFKHF